jgi:hypothetical protein
MRTLTKNEIARTSFKTIPNDRWESPYGYTNPHRDKNEMCLYCKNEDTEIIKDAAYVQSFTEFYGGKKFKVIYCTCCTAIFSFETEVK